MDYLKKSISYKNFIYGLATKNPIIFLVAIGCMSIPPKVVQFLRIIMSAATFFKESEQYYWYDTKDINEEKEHINFIISLHVKCVYKPFKLNDKS